MTTYRGIRIWLLATILAAASLTCHSDGTDIIAPPPAQPAAVVMVAGDGQTGRVNEPLPDSLVVRVEDAQGQPVGGVAVTWTVGGGGSVSSTSLLSGNDGLAAVRRMLGGTAGTQTTTGVVSSLPSVVFSATAVAGAQPRLAVKTQPSNATQDAVPLIQQPAVQVEDADGSPLGAGVPVTASVEGATLAGTTTAMSDGSGVAQFTDLALSGPAGSYHLTFSAPNFVAIQSSAINIATTSVGGGQWTPPFDWPIVAVHMMLLPDGRVLSMGRNGQPYVWDPATNGFTQVPSPERLFCSGHTLLADGRVLVVGGHITDHHGLPTTTLFSAVTNTWTPSATMVRGRWYPTATTMGNGDVVITAGEDQAGLDVTVPEVWSNGSVRQLTTAVQPLSLYPRAFVAPDGTLFVAGAGGHTKFLSLAGSGSWRQGPLRLFGTRDYGAAVMYDDGKIIYAGGARTTNTAEIIDLNQPNPQWSWTAPMGFARRHLNLTVLPSGEVLATGGVAGTAFDDVTKPVHPAEMWNPTTGQWTTLASNVITRGYHSTSLLMPDGRVLNSGSGDGAGAPPERNAELFSPPYLFRGARPTITNAPSEVQYGSQFRVLTPQASAITHVSFIRLGSVTHAFDENQRFMRLAFTADASGLTVTAPASGNRAPPGHYMLFILNGSDVPSVAKIVRIQ